MSDRDNLHSDRIAATERGASGVRPRWLTRLLTDPSPWVDRAIFVAVVGAVIFMIWVVFG
jgi:hypothetical protein